VIYTLSLHDALPILPWYYHTKWILLTSPVIIIICFALFFLFIKSILKKFGAFTASILIFGAIFPIAYIVYSGATVHDTWRHVFRSEEHTFELQSREN